MDGPYEIAARWLGDWQRKDALYRSTYPVPDLHGSRVRFSDYQDHNPGSYHEYTPRHFANQGSYPIRPYPQLLIDESVNPNLAPRLADAYHNFMYRAAVEAELRRQLASYRPL